MRHPRWYTDGIPGVKPETLRSKVHNAGSAQDMIDLFRADVPMQARLLIGRDCSPRKAHRARPVVVRMP